MSADATNVHLLGLPGPCQPAALLEVAKRADLQDAMILGFDQKGEFYMAASVATLNELQWLVTHAQTWISRELAKDLA